MADGGPGKLNEAEETKEEKKEREKEDSRYFMGYFKWHWSKHGLLRSLWVFNRFTLRGDLWFTFFHSIGLAFGAYLARMLLLRDEWLDVWNINYK